MATIGSRESEAARPPSRLLGLASLSRAPVIGGFAGVCRGLFFATPGVVLGVNARRGESGAAG